MLILLLNLPLFKEIIAFVIDNNKGWKIFNFHFPYSFHTYNRHSIKQIKLTIIKLMLPQT